MRIAYFTISSPSSSVNGIYIRGLRQNGVTVDVYPVKKKSPRQWLRFLNIASKQKPDIYMVGYGSPGLVIFLRVCGKHPIIYNALCSVYERLIVSRGLASRFSAKALYYWLLDFLSFNFSNLVMLETDSQINYCHKFFLVSRRKCLRTWIGADNDRFFYDPEIKKPAIFTVLFRGMFLPESGVEYAIRAAKILENQSIQFVIVGNGRGIDKTKELLHELKPENVKLITEFLSNSELVQLMQGCDLSLGQLSDHPRLNRTIPHKAYESLVMRLPYLTAASRGILELLKPNKTCLTHKPANADSLAEMILWAKNHPQELAKIAQNGYQLFIQSLTPFKLAGQILPRLNSLLG